MAASHTVSQLKKSYNPITPQNGIFVLSGFGINVRVERGHLLAEGGLGLDRESARLARVGHGLKRLVVIGSDGNVSLAALRWLADQDACFSMLNRDGTVLCTTGPVRPSDARLRRSQALATHTGVDVTIARELIDQKLAGQERVTREKLKNSAAAEEIADYRLALAEVESLAAIRSIESRGAAAYWSAWRDVQIRFPTKDIARTPAHWQKFRTRKSLISGSPRLAVNPANAMLNYLYAVLESEARLAAAALGLDPGLGFIHVDTPARDSLACDLMEAIRPKVDSYVLDWILQQPLSRDWFFEQRDGNCRLVDTFAIRLSQTAPLWASAVAPVAEWVAHTLWKSTRKAAPPERAIPTRLTQRRRSEGRGNNVLEAQVSAPKPEPICHSCGVRTQGRSHCPKCGREISGRKLTELAKIGRLVAQRPESRKKHSETQRRHRAAQREWCLKREASRVSEKMYLERIQPMLSAIPITKIASAIGVCESYAADIRAGRHRPHPRHWEKLAALVGMWPEPRPADS